MALKNIAGNCLIRMTCQMEGVNPFEDPIESRKHANLLRQQPEKWMPWTYREMGKQSSGSRQL